jgi:hypothetical protein
MSSANSESSLVNENQNAADDQDLSSMACVDDQEGYDQNSEEMKRRVAEMEEELLKISNMQQQVERQISSAADKIDENSM